MFNISSVRKIIVQIRKCTKIVIIIAIATFIILGIVSYFYKPIYSVTLNGELLGYSEDKSKLQQRINEYIEKGNGGNIAFVDIDDLPQYKLCLLKRNIVTSDDEIFEAVVSKGTQYYKYYAITVDNNEKLNVATFSEAEETINQLKQKNSSNKDKLGIVEKYTTEQAEYTNVEKAVSDLYEKKVVRTTSSTAVAATGTNTSSKVVNLGISLIRPVSGTVTSRFGARWGRSHKGIDIGAPKGTTIVAAASGTVTVSQYGYNGGYGNYVMISHGNGVQTLYGHCTSLLVSAGTYVTQGQPVATVGNTGDSTGNHLHLEIRVNGVAQNPQNYVY